MTHKTHDLVVKVGSYVVDGKDKARWLNVGRVMALDDGSELWLINRTFNPAGVPPDERGSDAVVIRKFEVERQQGGASVKPASEPRAPRAPARPGTSQFDALEDDIPFS